MKHRIYDEKSGNPQADNLARRYNTALNRQAGRHLHVMARSRQRRKIIKRIEGRRYLALVAAVAEDLQHRSVAP